MDIMERINDLKESFSEILVKARETAADDERLTLETDRCNSFYDVLHTMGRNASYHYYAQHRETFEIFSERDSTTAELFNTGVYADRDKIYQMFLCYHHYNNYPSTFHMHPVSTPYIQIAGDGKTAKLYMYTCGLEGLPSPPDQPPFSLWFYDAYSDEFVKEDDGWKWTRYYALDIIKAPYALSWSEMAKMPDRPVATGLIPASYQTDHHRPYLIGTLSSLGDTLPEPYETTEVENE